MGNIVITEDPGDVDGFKLGAWVFVINRGEDGDKFKLAETLDTEALLLGRKTYEVFVPSGPSRSGDFADKFNSLPKTSCRELEPRGRRRRAARCDARPRDVRMARRRSALGRKP